MISYGNTGQKKRYGIFECPDCGEHFTSQVSPVTRGLIRVCKTCSVANKAQLVIEKAGITFIEDCIQVHGDTYDYSLTKYTGAGEQITIICKIHGAFTQKANNHKNGAGCFKCGKESMAKIQASAAASTFIEESKEVHGEEYDYSLVDYINSNNKIKIICKKHGEFLQNPLKHKRGSGCPQCASYGFDKSKPAILYYLKVTSDGVTAYKIGITNRTIQERFNTVDLVKIRVLKTWNFLLGEDAYTIEQEILELHKESRGIGLMLLSSGNTELFNKDVLGYDKETDEASRRTNKSS